MGLDMGFALTGLIFVVVAIVLGVAGSEKPKRSYEHKMLVAGAWVAFSFSMVMFLSAVWTMVLAG